MSEDMLGVCMGNFSGGGIIFHEGNVMLATELTHRHGDRRTDFDPLYTEMSEVMEGTR